ncbi:peptidase dimerization domain-containing protein [Streptomyces malaysiensis]|uniref:Peptidase dimerization domain-containing protein n=1 Tax=Streptomyces malaysiensis subsp. samsunensis TaxID=459658 RepID=A0A9X2LSY4_STRMQ|nr:peptidase dimerization domain-containing protein [Streptomyces samsunensis]MCQ8828861.1 peptidase dimerization domain-containing protein [Streptomyces samsunensis]
MAQGPPALRRNRLDPFAGASAVHALAEAVPQITALNAPERGTTVNVGLISGGTGRNVIAARASCGIGIRIAEPEEMKRIDAAPHALAPSDRRVRLTVTALAVGLLRALAADAS